MSKSKMADLFERANVSKYAVSGANGIPAPRDDVPYIGMSKVAQMDSGEWLPDWNEGPPETLPSPPEAFGVPDELPGVEDATSPGGHQIRVVEYTMRPPTEEEEYEGNYYPDEEISDDEMMSVEPDEYDIEDGLTAADLAISRLRDLGTTEFNGRDSFDSADTHFDHYTGERSKRTAFLIGFSSAEIAAVAAGMSGRQASVNGRFVKLGFQFREPFIDTGENVKKPIMTGPRVEKILKRDPTAIPGPVQSWGTKMHKTRGEIPAANPIGAPTYGLPPGVGGEGGAIDLGEGQGRIIQVNQPRGDGGEFSQDPRDWTFQRVTPEGELDTGELSPRNLQVVQDEMERRLEDFMSRTTDASELFNKRMDAFFKPGEEGISNLLSQNFWTNFDRMIYGGSNGIAPIDSGAGRNFIAAIEQRKQEIANIQAGVGTQKQTMMSNDDVENSIFAMQCDALSELTPELWDSNPREYLNALSLLYSGDMDLMRINPLMVGIETERDAAKGIPVDGGESAVRGDLSSESGMGMYPPDVAKMLMMEAETASKNANIPTTFGEWVEKNTKGGREQGVDPLKILMQRWPMVRIGEDAMRRAAMMRKQVRDVSHFRGFTSGKTGFEVPNPLAQLHEKSNYTEEQALLDEMKDALMGMVDLKLGSGMADNSFEQVLVAGPGLVEEMDAKVMRLLELAGQLYSSDRFVTKDERLNATYDRGQATKMEIMLKAMLISQTWKSFLYKRIPEMAEQQGVDPAALEEALVGGSLEGETTASIRSGYMRVADMADEIGCFGLADAIETMLGV
jgi:hypothetical protein